MAQSHILSFGASAIVLEPVEIREEIKKRIADMKKNYDLESGPGFGRFEILPKNNGLNKKIESVDSLFFLAIKP